MYKCQRCGTPLQDGATFCPVCGALAPMQERKDPHNPPENEPTANETPVQRPSAGETPKQGSQDQSASKVDPAIDETPRQQKIAEPKPPKKTKKNAKTEEITKIAKILKIAIVCLAVALFVTLVVAGFITPGFFLPEKTDAAAQTVIVPVASAALSAGSAPAIFALPGD